MRKKITKLFIFTIVCVFSIVGCSLSGGIDSKTFNITVNDVDGNSSKHSVVLEFNKTKDDLKYFLYQDGEEVANGNVGTKGGTKEYILDSGTKSKFEYKIKVICGDDELIKETTYKVGSSENTSSESENKDKDKVDETDNDVDKENTENTEEEATDKEDTNSTTQTAGNEWSGESKEYKAGDKVTQDGVAYECINDHTSQAAWAPKEAASLWKKVE